YSAAPANITLTADASDSDGTIAKVEFFSGTTLLGTDTEAPYSFEWTNVPAGSYTVIVKATDNDGLVTTAEPVSVQVLAEPAAPDVAAISTGLFNAGWAIAATSPAPRSFEAPGNDVGDIELKVNGAPVKFLEGITAVANWNNPGNVGVSSANNIASPYGDASGNAFVNVMDNSINNASTANPATVEESAGTAVAHFPFSAGFVGGIVSANGAVLASNLPAGTAISKAGTGLYIVSGLSLSGNLLAFPNGDTGTDVDNVVSVRISNGTWIIDTRDNGVGAQDDSFSFVYLPAATTGVLNGAVSSAGALTTLNGELSTLGATVVQSATHVDITFGDGSLINPTTAALFITADSGTSLEAADNIISYEAAGNAFRVFTQDLPELNGTFQPIDFRFTAVPLDLDSSTVPTKSVVSISATDSAAGEYGDDQALAFTVTRTAPVTAALTVSYSTSGATNGSDFATLSGSIEIPAGESSAVVSVTVLTDDAAEGPETLAIT
ncbi:MAG: hypothetical protein EOP85_15035, partial [Verrucomicrobiaceae bacterium]